MYVANLVIYIEQKQRETFVRIELSDKDLLKLKKD